MTRPRVLVVAGHDSSGRAGLDADREALERFGAEIVPVATAWTRQAGGRVHDVVPRPPGVWREEAGASLAGTAAWKSGLLPGAEAVRALAELVRAHGRGRPVVCDPVLAASGGEVFLDDAGVAALRAELLPCGVVVTPNLAEAARLAEVPAEPLVDDPSARVRAAEALLALGARGVVLKAGHGSESPAADLVLEPGGEPIWLRHPRIPGASLRGSGCRHASAVAALLAAGTPLAGAAEAAGRWLGERLGGQPGGGTVGERPAAR